MVPAHQHCRRKSVSIARPVPHQAQEKPCQFFHPAPRTRRFVCRVNQRPHGFSVENDFGMECGESRLQARKILTGILN